MKDALRTSDIVIRYGGDEFVCIMPNTTRQKAEQICHRMLNRCKVTKFGDIGLTISIGIASYPDDGIDFEELLRIADESLYDAKRSGRDRIGTTTKRRIEIPPRAFIDRSAEKEVLREFLLRDNSGVRTALIKGMVGIGKTRLLKEVLNSISGREIMWSDCLAFREEMPYYPIREMIKYKISRRGKGILEDIPLAYRIEIGKLIPELIDGLGGSIEEIGLVMDRYRLYESIKRIIEIGERRKVIVIDNMQWVDRETTEVVKYLLRSLRDNPVLFLLTYRQEEKSEFLEDFTSYISREIEVKEIELGPFEHNGISEMIRVVLGEDSGRELVGYIGQESGGNPFYIEEIIKGLSEQGYLKIIGDAWQFDKPGKEIIPKSIEDITGRKYQRMSSEGKELLQLASVIGRFDIEIIKEITGYNEGHIIGLIEHTKKLGLIKEDRGRFEFQEEISRDAIYKRYVAGAKRRMLHRHVAEKLEEQHKGKEQVVIEELAFHYYRGAQKEKGVRYCIEAGDSAKAKYANTNAIQYYTWAEELLKQSEEEENKKLRLDCLLKRIGVLSLIGENEVALEDLEKALKDAKGIRDKKREADIRHKRATVYLSISQYHKVIEEATRCEEIFKETGDEEGTAELSNSIGNAYLKLGDYYKALNYYKKALKVFRNIGKKDGEAGSYNNIGNIYTNLGDNAKALKYFKNSLKISKNIEDRLGESLTLANLGIVYKHSGNYKRALECYEKSLKINNNIGRKDGEAIASNNIGNIHLALGDNNRALKYFKDGLEIFKDTGNKDAEITVLANIAIIYENLGDYNRALNKYEDALEIFRDTGNKEIESGVLNNIGNIHFKLGDYKKALKYFEDSLRLAEKIKANERTFYVLLSLTDLYLMLNQMKRAKNFIDKAYGMAGDSKDMLKNALFHLGDFCLEEKNFKKFKKIMSVLHDLLKDTKSKRSEANVNLFLGRYYTQTKYFEKANKHLKKALKVFREIGERLNIGKVYYYMGMMELAMRKRAVYRKYFGKSLGIFDSLGAKGWKEKVEKALENFK
jgi:tetratricopeptide (TPR) repeat protein